LRKKELKSYFWDYNTVEACLLACAILVCLAGVMFESDRFQMGPNGEESKYAWQRNLITYCTILIILGSLVYYGCIPFRDWCARDEVPHSSLCR